MRLSCSLPLCPPFRPSSSDLSRSRSDGGSVLSCLELVAYTPPDFSSGLWLGGSSTSHPRGVSTNVYYNTPPLRLILPISESQSQHSLAVVIARSQSRPIHLLWSPFPSHHPCPVCMHLPLLSIYTTRSHPPQDQYPVAQLLHPVFPSTALMKVSRCLQRGCLSVLNGNYRKCHYHRQGAPIGQVEGQAKEHRVSTLLPLLDCCLTI